MICDTFVCTCVCMKALLTRFRYEFQAALHMRAAALLASGSGQTDFEEISAKVSVWTKTYTMYVHDHYQMYIS